MYKILIVEDDLTIARVLDDRLKSWGYSVRAVSDFSRVLENKGKTVSRDAIMKRLWESDSFIDDNTLTVNMTRLRKRLLELGLQNFIHTKKGLGYLIEND